MNIKRLTAEANCEKSPAKFMGVGVGVLHRLVSLKR
jgi:hypothetical protein